MKEQIKKSFIEIVESIEVDGYYRSVNRFDFLNTSEGISIRLSEFKNHDESMPEIDLGTKIHNKWYFRLYNKFIEEYTNSEEDYISTNDNNSTIKFYTDWIKKLEYTPYNLYITLSISGMTGFIRDKKISKLLEIIPDKKI
jgi:hypothetical protein